MEAAPIRNWNDWETKYMLDAKSAAGIEGERSKQNLTLLDEAGQPNHVKISTTKSKKFLRS